MSRVLVVGAGIIGIATAVQLQRRGHQVFLVDRDEPATGCSRGNAGIIAVSDVLPLITLERIASLPAMMLNGVAPVAVRPGALPALLPWLARAARTLTPARQARITTALAALGGRALESWRQLLDHAGGRGLLIERGMIELIRSPTALETLRSAADRLATLGQPVRLLDGRAVLALEPSLAGSVAGGLLHQGVGHVLDPHRVAIELLRCFCEGGGVLLREAVRSASPLVDGVVVALDRHEEVFDSAVICTGYAAADLMRQHGFAVPIQIERGYHLHFPHATGLISRPLVFRREGFVATPMATGLRLAGTVEFARARTPPDWRRAAMLASLGAAYFSKAIDTRGAAQWMGNRPSLPDSLPAIGTAFGGRLLYAFGHQHLGLTHAAVTSELVADLHDRRAPAFDPNPFSLKRFGGSSRKRERATP